MTEPKKSKGFWEDLPDLSKPILPKIIPQNIKSNIIKVTNWPLARKVSDFLMKHFGNPPKSPILKISPSEFYENSAHTFVWLSEKTGLPIGTIRYRPWGKDNKRVYWQVDCFCVDKEHRAKGIGTWLLKYLHYWANSHGIPYAVFIKEGQPVSIPKLPFKTGIYAYIDVCDIPVYKQSFSLKEISSVIAEKWVKSFSITTIFPCDNNINYNSSWYLYKSELIWLIIRAEKTNQIGPTGQLGWLTNIYESPSWKSISFLEQTKHITMCSQEISSRLNWGSVWIDSEWVETGDSENSSWKLDGPYYYYSFQW